MVKTRTTKDDVSFFTNDKGKLENCKTCDACPKLCKQSFRVTVVSCKRKNIIGVI